MACRPEAALQAWLRYRAYTFLCLKTFSSPVSDFSGSPLLRHLTRSALLFNGNNAGCVFQSVLVDAPPPSPFILMPGRLEMCTYGNMDIAFLFSFFFFFSL